MKLFSIVDAAEVQLHQKLTVVGGVLVGHEIEVQLVKEPSENIQGLIYYKFPGDNQQAPVENMLPRLAGCVFIEDDSLMASISYDNEKSLHATLADMIESVKFNGHEVRTLLLGEKEWIKLGSTQKMTRPPKPEFMRVKCVQLPYYSSIVIIEYGLQSKKED